MTANKMYKCSMTLIMVLLFRFEFTGEAVGCYTPIVDSMLGVHKFKVHLDINTMG